MASARKVKTIVTEEAQLQLLYGDDSRFKYWESHLFNEVYLRRDLPEKHSEKWDDTESVGFQNFMNILRNLATEYKNQEKELEGWSETETINKWVRHVLEALGWKNNCTGVQDPYLEETSFRYGGKTYRTDILIVDHPKEAKYINKAKGDEKLVEARQSVIMPVEVKYWQRLEEYRQGKTEETKRRDNETDDLEKTLSPNEQIVQYMDVLKKSWGILTDGAKWRLFNSEISSEDTSRFYEFNLYSLIQSMNTEETEADRNETLEAAKYFYHFFSKETFYSKDQGEESFVGEVLRYSKKYVNRVEEDLKNRFVKAMNIACNEFYKLTKSPSKEKDLRPIRNVSESVLFNILFIKSLESRGILPMDATDYRKISLSSIIDKIERFDPDKDDVINFRELDRAFRKGNGNSFDFKNDGTELHDRLIRLMNVIHEGGSPKDSFGFEISGFKECIFSDSEWNLFKSHKISNISWVRILFQLGYADADSNNRKYQQIPYNYFTPRQLGSIYESFLEFKLDVASEDMVYEKKQWRPASLNSPKYRDKDLPKVKSKELFFSPNNEDRKASGSFYTPDYVVNHIVEKTLFPILSKLSYEKILTVTVCDPAMGSGHFLAAAMNYISRFALSKAYQENHKDLDRVRRTVIQDVLKGCIFGVDTNPSAVKLTKMSLWLESANINTKLEDLNDQIFCGDSLETNIFESIPKFSWNAKIFEPKGIDGFTALLMNPPYQNHKLVSNESRNAFSKLYPEIYKTKADISNYFLLKAKDLLEEGGRLGLITSRYFLDGTQSEDLRQILNSNFSFDEIVNYENFQVFEANTLTVTLIGSKTADADGANKVKVELFDDSLVGKKISVWPVDSIKTFSRLQKDIFSAGASELRQNSGTTSKIKSDLKLGDLFFTGRGGSTGLDKAFVMTKSEAKQKKIESEFLVDCLKNGDIRAFHFYKNEMKKMIYTKKGKPLPSSSGAYKVLSPHKDALTKRTEVKSGKIEWYEYSLYRCRDKFDSQVRKIVFPYMATDNRYFLDTEGIFFCSDVGMIVEEKSYCSLEALVTILNSALYNQIHRQVAKLKRGGYYEYISSGIQEYPMPKEISKSVQTKLESCYSEIVEGIALLKKEFSHKQEFEKIEAQFLKYPNYIDAKRSEIAAVNRIIQAKRKADEIVMGLFDAVKKVA